LGLAAKSDSSAAAGSGGAAGKRRDCALDGEKTNITAIGRPA